jgi:hypothetical protein
LTTYILKYCIGIVTFIALVLTHLPNHPAAASPYPFYIRFLLQALSSAFSAKGYAQSTAESSPVVVPAKLPAMQ